MSDNNQDRSQDEGQSGIDRETEQRNRENETGQEGGQPPSGQAPSGDGGFVGTGSDAASDNLTKDEQDFAAEGQGAQDSDAGTSDIETGQSQDNDPSLDDGSDSNH